MVSGTESTLTMAAIDITSISAVLLAAGTSTRMDHAKQLIEWGGMPLVEYQVTQLVQAGIGEVVVVVGHQATDVIPHIRVQDQSPAVHIVENPDYHLGKTTSITAGLRALRAKAKGFMVFAVDQPRSSDLLRTLAENHLKGDHLISVPEYKGKHGHPPVFNNALISELLSISEDQQGLRAVIEAHRDLIKGVAVDSPLALTNLNTQEDYEQAKMLRNFDS